MKTILSIIAVLFILGSCSDEPRPDTRSTAKSLNRDSLLNVQKTNKSHWEFFDDVYSKLQLDSFDVTNEESYRLVVSHGWSNPYGGTPSSITFHKTKDTCYVVIKDYYGRTEPKKISRKVKFISAPHFDSVAKMFRSPRFWNHTLTTYECTKLSFDADRFIFEARKSGKHKIVSQFHCFDTIPFLDNWQYNFLHYSGYSEWFEKDYEWHKNNPPGNVKTPGPPSALRYR
jgi:hypothetical protein